VKANNDEPVFPDLPAALVEEMLNKAQDSGEEVLVYLNDLKKSKNKYREILEENGFIHSDSQLGYAPAPTTCGIDGSYTVERLLSVDLLFAAAIAIEGLTPPSESRHWELPHHLTYSSVERHSSDTTTILRAIMIGEELLLAVNSPHDVVMLDMTLTLPIIYFNQATIKANELSYLKCSKKFIYNIPLYLKAYENILTSVRSDQHFIGIPKYSTRREIGNKFNFNINSDDRGLLTILLNPSELTIPISIARPDSAWHLNTNHIKNINTNELDVIVKNIIHALNNLHIIYYKPQMWLPALRIETPQNMANNSYRMSIVIQGLKHQCSTSSILEPYPLYMADRMVKSLSSSAPAFKHIATRRISESYEGNIGEVFFAMHGYRSDRGR
jgi:hypothetical protein